MTRISFTRGLQDRPESEPPEPPGAGTSLGLVVACAALAVLALALSLTVFFTMRGLGKSHAPAPLGAVAITVPVQDFAVPSAPVAGPPGPAAARVLIASPAPIPAPAPPAPAPPPAAGQTTDKSPAMLATLRRAKGVITLQVEDDPGAEASARDMARLFRAAGWTVNWNSVIGSGPSFTGFSAALGGTPQDEAVRRAFADAGIELAPPPSSAGIVQTPEIFVGADR